MSRRDEPSSPRRRRRAILFAVLALVVVLAGASAWVGIRAVLARGELEDVRSATAALQDAATGGDLGALPSLSGDLSEHAAAAGLTGDPVWRLAESVPWIGPNLGAVRAVASSADTLAKGVVAPLVEIAPTLPTALRDGGVDVDVLRAAAGPAARAQRAVGEASAALDGVDTAALLGPVRDAVEQLERGLAALAPTVTGLADATAVLPAMLGGDTPRSILLVFQNNAELRTGGGITGSFVELRADAGRLSLVRQADSSQFPVAAAPVAGVPDSTVALYGDGVGRFVQNTSIPADFTVTAGLIRAWWGGLTGTPPDTLVSLDPVVLKAVLQATGPVTLPDGSSLTADTLVDQLVVAPYLALDSAAQTDYFAAAVQAVFSRVTSGGVDAIALGQALAGPLSEGRLSAWTTDADSQTILAGGALGGPAVRQQSAGDDAFAVYFNDTTGAKMDVFLDVAITAGSATCRADDRSEVEVVLTMTSTAPADIESYPFSVTGGGLFGVAIGDIGTDVAVAAPTGWFFGDVVVKDERYAAVQVEDAGHPTSLATVNLSPGEVNELRFRFIAFEPGEVSPMVVHTPMLSTPSVGAAEVACG